MYKNKTFSPYRVVGTMLKNWHFSPVDAVADGGTAPADANPITKAAEKYAESRISNVTAYNPMAKHIRKADKGRKWEDTIIKLVDSVAYARNVAPQAPTPPDILSMTYKTNTSRQFKTSLYEKDVDAVVRGDMEAQELNDKIVGALAESRDDADYIGLRDMLTKLAYKRLGLPFDTVGWAGLNSYITQAYQKRYSPLSCSIHESGDLAGLVENIIAAVAKIRMTTNDFTGHITLESGSYNPTGDTSFKQKGNDISIYCSSELYAKILVYLKGTRAMDFADLGAALIPLDEGVTFKDHTDKTYDFVCVIDDRAIGLVHYGNEVRAGAFNPDAWATPFVLNEVGNFYYSEYFNSAFHLIQRA